MGAYDSDYNAREDVLTQLNPTGRLLYSTYQGGSNDNLCKNITVDNSENLYLIGSTNLSHHF
ncbi:MAG: SBBP repeat-containing protein [Bacteroidia bacterium]